MTTHNDNPTKVRTDVRLHSKRVVQGTLPISCRLRKDDALAKGLQNAFDEDGRTCRDTNLGGQQRFHDVGEGGDAGSCDDPLIGHFQFELVSTVDTTSQV